MNFFRVCSLKSEKLFIHFKGILFCKHVKLARDRRKRKSRIKAAIFFAALLLILTGIFLAFKDTADYDPSLQSNLEPEMVDNVQYQSLTPEKTESDKSQPQAGEHPEAKQNANTEDCNFLR